MVITGFNLTFPLASPPVQERYPLLYVSQDMLTLRDVRQLLVLYKELALKYEALSQVGQRAVTPGCDALAISHPSCFPPACGAACAGAWLLAGWGVMTFDLMMHAPLLSTLTCE